LVMRRAAAVIWRAFEHAKVLCAVGAATARHRRKKY